MKGKQILAIFLGIFLFSAINVFASENGWNRVTLLGDTALRFTDGLDLEGGNITNVNFINATTVESINYINNITTNVNNSQFLRGNYPLTTADIPDNWVNESGDTITGNLTILGTLIGGSPVKIAGINVSNNVFTHTENENKSLRFTLENENAGSNATSVIRAKNDVGETMNIGIGSSNFMVGEKDYPSITALFSRSQGKTVFANFYKQMFLWLYNPTDDNDPTNLVELMRLDENGLNVTGNITGNQIYGNMARHSDGNITIPILNKGEYTNVTGFDQNIVNGMTQVGNKSMIIGVGGMYDVAFSVSFGGSANKEILFAVAVNNVSTDNVHSHRVLGTKGDIGTTTGMGFIRLNKDDDVTLQVKNIDGTQDVDVAMVSIKLIRIGD